MPNSKVNEKNIFLPGGGSQSPFVRPPQINQTGSVPGSMNQAVAQADPATVLGSSAAKPPQNYFQGSGDTFQLTDYAKGAVASLQPTTSPATPYTPSETDPTASVYNYMLQPSEEEKRLAKNNESKKRLLLLGDALRHIGNLYYTTKGATPQQFNSPVMTQEQIYQQKRAELQAQRAAAFKNSLEQAKLDADNRNKAFQQQMAVANYQRNLSNDEWNRQFNATKFAHQQKKDEQDYGLNLRKFDETIRSNKANEKLRRQSNATAAMNAQTSRDRLNFEKGENGGLPKGKIYLPHSNMSTGGSTKWIIDEKTYKNAIPAIYNAMRKANIIQPLSSSNLFNDTGEERFAKMRQLVESQYTSDIYNSWMERLGATTSDGYKETTQDRIVRQGDGGIHPRKKSTK